MVRTIQRYYAVQASGAVPVGNEQQVQPSYTTPLDQGHLYSTEQTLQYQIISAEKNECPDAAIMRLVLLIAPRPQARMCAAPAILNLH